MGGQKDFSCAEDMHSQKAVRADGLSMPYARVLVVDDNHTNLEAAKGLMKPYRMQIDCVLSGKQAIEAIESGQQTYDAIFMDHMMPEMDGVKATQAIRNLGTAYAQSIPIIALTASETSGAEDMFLEKGFQAFLSKPIDIARLDEVLRRWVLDKEKEKAFLEQLKAADKQAKTAPQKGQDRRVTAERRSGIDRRKTFVKFVGMDLEKWNERYGSDNTSLEVLSSYAINTRPLLEKIADVSAETLEEYAIIVHGIKGSSWGIFAKMIGDTAESLENAAKAGDIEYVKKHNQTFINAVWKLVYDIEDMLYANSIDTEMPTKDKPDRAVLLELLEACEAFSMDGAEEAIEKLSEFRYESDDGLTDWLRENVKRTNLKQIAERLSDICGGTNEDLPQENSIS